MRSRNIHFIAPQGQIISPKSTISIQRIQLIYTYVRYMANKKELRVTVRSQHSAYSSYIQTYRRYMRIKKRVKGHAASTRTSKKLNIYLDEQYPRIVYQYVCSSYTRDTNKHLSRSQYARFNFTHKKMV